MNRSAVVMMVAAACCLADAAQSQERNPLEASVIVDVGWFFMSTDTRVRVDGETTGARGTDVDYDDTFGLGDFDRFRAEAFWRIADRHTLRAMYFENNRNGTRDLSREISFGDQTFPVGAAATGRSELTVVQLAYDYAFLRRENYELAGGIGVHMLDLGLSIDATITGQDDLASQSIVESATTTAPLPVLALRGIWRLPHNFYISAQAQYFYIPIDPYEGSLTDLKATIVWQATDHLGIGVGYNDFGFRFDVDDEGNFEGRLRWDYGGAVAFATFMF